MKRINLLLMAVICLGATSLIAQTTSTKKSTTSKASVPMAPEGLEIGNMAPDIVMQTPEGKMLSLSSLRGKIVLIDFWAAWCGPCRMENPNVVNAYHKYKNAKYERAKGFTVFSVSLDKAKENWVKAISQDKLEWENHVSDLQWWNSAAGKTYRVQSIPASWLVDENGIIIGKNLRGISLDESLEKLVKK